METTLDRRKALALFAMTLCTCVLIASVGVLVIR